MNRFIVVGLLAALPALAEPVKLTDLKPTGVEYGMADCGYPSLKMGKWVIDPGPWGLQAMGFWTTTNKVVKAYPAGFELPAGEAYKSLRTDAFAVEGELVTGVGLLSKMACMYYWVEYAIPTAAKTFTAKLFITDDVAGANFHVVAGNVAANQKAVVRISADDKVIYEKTYERWKVTIGSGIKLDDVAIDLPAGAKTIRFFIHAPALDDNVNNEVVIHDGKFE